MILGVSHNTASMIDVSNDFNINPVVSQSFHNDSGVSDINDCVSIIMNIVLTEIIGHRNINTTLLVLLKMTVN